MEVIKKNFVIIVCLLFLLQGCGCKCPEIPKPTNDDYTTTASSVIVYSDACAPSDGSTAAEGKAYSSSTPVPNAQCDTWSGGSSSNRGRWVMVPPPNSSTGGGNAGGLYISDGSTVTITAYGTVYFCSSGYDNFNYSPTAAVHPGAPSTSVFYDNKMNTPTEMAVEKGQLIILNIGDPSSNCSYSPSNTFCSPGNGVAIGVTGNDALSLPVCASNQYSSFTSGQCRATGGFGLTVYIGSQEVVTLDNQNYTGSDSFYTDAASRTPNLYSPFMSPSSTSSFFNTVDQDYSEDVSPAGPIQYVFLAPYTGILKFSIAGTTNNSAGGYGQYNVTALTAPSSCAVSNSTTSTEDDRGSLQVLFEASGINPNTVDNVLATFNNYDPTLSIYYPELMQYLANSDNIQLNSDTSALNDLLVPSTGTNTETGEPNYNPLIMTSQVNSGSASVNGYIWLKVRDDYYHDNVGAYKVDVQVQTPNQSQVSAFLNSLITPINKSLMQTSDIIYNNFFSPNNNFMAIIHMSLLIYIMVFGAQYILGLNNISLKDTFIRILKIAVMIELLQPNSLDFYNQYFFNIFTQGQAFLITAVTGDSSTNYQGVFGFVDDVFNIFFSAYTWQQLAALLPDIIGFLYAIILIMIMFIYLTALTQVFIVYLLALVGLYLLISLAPMFMLTLLFQRTKKIFLGWVKYLFSFAIQPVILFAVLYVVNEIFMVLWENAMSFDICWGGVWTLYFYGVYIWTYNVIEPFTIGCVWYYGIMNELPIYEMFAEVMMLYFFVLNTQAIISYAPKISDSIADTGGAATSLVNISSKIIASAAKVVTGDPIAKANKMNAQNNRQASENSYNKKMDKRVQGIRDFLTPSRKDPPPKPSEEQPKSNAQSSTAESPPKKEDKI